MAIDKYIIIYITLVIHKTTSTNIRRDLCLETVVRFVNHQNKCDFNNRTAEEILQNNSTCPEKCNFRIDNLHGRRYPLKRIDLTIGNETASISSCSGSPGYQRYLYINCSSWNAKEYITWDRVYDCGINDAQCVQIDNYCVCHCMPGYIAEGEKCLKIRVDVSGICEHNWQCKGTEFANICDHGLCVCNSGYIYVDRKCYKDINIVVTLGTLFGGLILGVIITAVVMSFMYRRLRFPTRKIQEPDVLFADKRTYVAANGAKISFSNDSKQKVATVSLYSFTKETPGCNLPGKQQNEGTEDVYNHLHEQTEHADDTYDHACTATNHGTDLPEYSHSRDIATVQITSPILDGGDYSTLGQ